MDVIENTQIQPQNPLPVESVPPKNGYKIAFFVVLGLILVSGLAYAGMTLSKQSAPPVVPPQKSPTPTLTQVVQPITIPASDETANWKIYTNTKYGFEFKYPSNFRILDGVKSNSVRVELNQQEGMPTRWLGIKTLSLNEAQKEYGIYINTNTKVGEVIIDSKYNADEYSKFKRLENRVIGGIEAKEYVNENPWEIPIEKLIIFSKGEIFFAIQYIPYNSPQEDVKKFPGDSEAKVDFVKIFDQILSTFKFTE